MKKMMAFFFILVSMLSAQDGNFGKNKVQYKPFNWSFIQSSHFDIYFYDGGASIANFTAVAAESAYASISNTMRYQLNNRISIMVYNSHNDFQQTNVVGEYLEEGIGGVTELFKNRVVLPFEGNYRQFRHVIHHELVHAVMNDMFYGGSIQSIISNNIRIQLPMWISEGFAEYEALKWDTNSDMFMRDATINTYLPPIEYLNGYFAYRGGQSVFHYIANKYGEQKIAEILHRMKSLRNVDAGFKSAIGLTVEELSDRWQKEQKVLYWPDVAKREDPEDFATRMTNHVKESNFYNTSPAISPQGDKIAFISDRDDYFSVYVISTIDNTLTKVIAGQRTNNFEELHLLTPGIDWSPDGKRIAVAAKSGERDAVYLIDVASGDQEKIEFQLDGIFTVDWSPKGDRIAFIGNSSSQSDLFVYDLATKKLMNLTEDPFSDSDPVWSPDGTMIYFVSDRRENVSRNMLPANFRMVHFNFRQLDVYSIDVEKSIITRITNDDMSDESSPVVSPDGKKLLYVSDRNGNGNVYERDLVTGQDRPITNSITGVYQLSLSADGNKLAFSALEKAGFDIFLLKTPFERKLGMTSLEPTEYIKRKKGNSAKPVDSVVAAAPLVEKKEDTTNVYGENVKIDFNTYVFTDDGVKERESESDIVPVLNAKSLSISGNIDDDSNFIVNKYKLNFSPDIVYGNAAFSTFYGVQGTTMMSFSDMLGDHQIYFLTNLLLDLKNSDYVLAYYYLPQYIDYGVQGYHSARFLYLEDPLGVSLYRFRTWGLSASASLPLDRFYRFEFGMSWMNLLRENLEYSSVGNQKRELIIPSISFVHDNTLWGYTAPNNGSRYNINAMFSPKFGKSSLDFQTITADYRTYYKFWRNYSFVVRYSGGISLGKNAQQFFIGGTDGWINREFENGGIPIVNIEDFAFLTPALPMRGFNYNIRNGTKYALANFELRYPFIQYLVTGGLPIALGNITGATFLDIGSSWTRESAYKGISKDAQGKYVTGDLLIGTGMGIRMFVFGLPLKIDVAWSYNGDLFSSPKYYFSLGGDF
ncbi:MAG: PD40 domain-containing protein [Bacteroidetes bacterium]|nr:PD40 domain-containing protein [Bacteroidota bacterium]